MPPSFLRRGVARIKHFVVLVLDLPHELVRNPECIGNGVVILWIKRFQIDAAFDAECPERADIVAAPCDIQPAQVFSDQPLLRHCVQGRQ